VANGRVLHACPYEYKTILNKVSVACNSIRGPSTSDDGRWKRCKGGGDGRAMTYYSMTVCRLYNNDNNNMYVYLSHSCSQQQVHAIIIIIIISRSQHGGALMVVLSQTVYRAIRRKAHAQHHFFLRQYNIIGRLISDF